MFISDLLVGGIIALKRGMCSTFRISCSGDSGSECVTHPNDCQPAALIPLEAKPPSAFMRGLGRRECVEIFQIE